MEGGRIVYERGGSISGETYVDVKQVHRGRHRVHGGGRRGLSSYRGCRLNVARLGGTSDATSSPVLHQGIGSPEDFALRDLARRATIGLVLR